MNSATSAAPVDAGSANDIALPNAPRARSRQQRDRDDRLKLLFDALVRAANNSAECPSNKDLSQALGYSGPSTASDLMVALEAMGFITVERSSSMRVVTIVKTGKKTAGVIAKPVTRSRWTDDDDANLMDGVAEGETFDTIAQKMRTTKSACVSRFHTLARRMGEQAA